MKIKHILILASLLALALPAVTLAGHHYGGGNCGGPCGMTRNWNMTEMDTDGNGELNFDEFTAPNLKRWRYNFDMIDADKNGSISSDEWKALLEAHGVKKE